MGERSMLVQKYKDMLSGKSVIRQLSEFATARGQEIGYENVFDYSLGNPSVPVPREFTDRMIHMLATKEPLELHGIVQASVLQVSGRQLLRIWRRDSACPIAKSTFLWRLGRRERWHMLFVW